MRSAIAGLNTLQGYQLREDKLQQAGAVQIYESFGRDGRQQYLIQFIRNPLFGYDGNAFFVTAQRLKSIIINIEIQLGGKADAAHHTQRVVTESDVRVKRRTNGFLLHILHSSKRVHQFSIAMPVQANRQRIDGKVPPVLVILQRTVLNNRLARIVCVGLLTRTHKLHFRSMILQLRRTEILENREMSATAQTFGKSLSHNDSATYHYHINIFGRTLQEYVTHVAADYVTFQSQFIRRF